MSIEKERMTLRLPPELMGYIKEVCADPLRPNRTVQGALSAWIETACWERRRREEGTLSTREKELVAILRRIHNAPAFSVMPPEIRRDLEALMEGIPQ